MIGRSQRQGHERQRAVGAAAGRQRRRANHEQVFVIVGAAETVADAACRDRCPCGSRRQDDPNNQTPTACRSAGRCSPSPCARIPRCNVRASRLRARWRGIELAIDLRHRIAVTILRRRIERQPAVGGRMRVVIGAQANGTTFERARRAIPSATRHQAAGVPSVDRNRGSFPGGTFPDASVVANERLIRRAAEILARNQAVRHVLTRERLIVDRRPAPR